jgi:hypothetical protein
VSRFASLDRLRDISRQRTTRKPLLIPVPPEGFADGGDAPKTKIEWPVTG